MNSYLDTLRNANSTKRYKEVAEYNFIKYFNPIFLTHYKSAPNAICIEGRAIYTSCRILGSPTYLFPVIPITWAANYCITDGDGNRVIQLIVHKNVTTVTAHTRTIYLVNPAVSAFAASHTNI